jgi:hypothetical protein
MSRYSGWFPQTDLLYSPVLKTGADRCSASQGDSAIARGHPATERPDRSVAGRRQGPRLGRPEALGLGSLSKRWLADIAHCERRSKGLGFQLGLLTHHGPTNPIVDDYMDDTLSPILLHAYSVRIHPGISKARFTMDSSERLRRIHVYGRGHPVL